MDADHEQGPWMVRSQGMDRVHHSDACRGLCVINNALESGAEKPQLSKNRRGPSRKRFDFNLQVADGLLEVRIRLAGGHRCAHIS
jgi:hypothetical protein